jgi:leucyl aminopeptidase
MHIDWQIAPLSRWQGDAILFFGFERSLEPLPGFQRWLMESGSWLQETQALEDFQGKFKQLTVYYAPPDHEIARVVCVGLGKREEFDLDKWRAAVACGLCKCRDLQVKRPILPLLAFEGLGFDLTTLLEEGLIGGLVGLYRYDAPKKKDEDLAPQLEELFIVHEEEPFQSLKDALTLAVATASGVILTRDLTIAPANQITPAFLLNTAQQLAETHHFEIKIIDVEEAQALGMGAFLAVAMGSSQPAYVILLEHVPLGTEEVPPLVFVGKGITFDTGGISLKSRDKMELMKHDMAGAAAILGAFDTLGKLKVQRRVVGILACAENMPDGKAYKPGDVITSLSGLTIEAINTDAEGRMVLCDAITYVQQYQPALIVDVATLTGACIIALGDQVAGIMGNREGLVQQVQKIGMKVGEKLWPLPLWDFYFEDLKSDVADFKNVGDRKAGSIIGGIFLKQFVPQDVPWIHLDIAGPAWTEKDLPTAARGATGFGVRILVEIARHWPELESQ